MSRPHEAFARELEQAGLDVRRKSKNDFAVYSQTGQLLGAFGHNVEHGRTKQNILGQIKRATGIAVKTGRVRR